ncbi:MAG: hypothetical protein DRJ03_22395 [Chloroflexi bacterium]|nr:MAG: hypothetical protein DRJ03_22395 [Chloroflexota bacterium]
MLKLNIGCGPYTFPGWHNIDKEPGPGIILRDVRRGLPYPDNSVDLIYASHFLEHLNIIEALRFLRECHRVMKRGAVMRLAVPDFGLLLEKWVRREMGDFAHCQPPIYQQLNEDNKLACILFGALSGREEYTGHQHAYTWDGLKEALEMAGFKRIVPMRPGESHSPVMQAETQDYHQDHSLYVEAIKE